MEGITILFTFIGVLALTTRLMKIIDWFEPTSTDYRRRRTARHCTR